MPLAKDLIGPFPVGQARAIGGGVQSAVTAAGSSQSDATDLTASINVVTTATAGQGVQLPAMDVGDECEVLNLGSGAIWVYPADDERINNLATDAGFVLAQYTAVKVKKYTSTRCIAYLSA